MAAPTRRACLTLVTALASAVPFALVALAPTPAAAKPPATRNVFLFGGRTNTGDLGARYRLGYVLGFETGYQPGFFGVSSSIFWSTNLSSSERNVEGELDILELGAALRLRASVTSDDALLVAATAGVDLIRTSMPTGPGGGRQHVGPSAGLGAEVVVGGELLAGLSARYGAFAGGPAGFTLVLSVGIGAE